MLRVTYKMTSLLDSGEMNVINLIKYILIAVILAGKLCERC